MQKSTYMGAFAFAHTSLYAHTQAGIYVHASICNDKHKLACLKIPGQGSQGPQSWCSILRCACMQVPGSREGSGQLLEDEDSSIGTLAGV